MRMHDKPDDPRITHGRSGGKASPALRPPPVLRPALPELLANHPWIAFVLPLATFMAVGCFEPKPPAADAWPLRRGLGASLLDLSLGLHAEDRADHGRAGRGFGPRCVSLPRRVTAWSLVVGIVGVFLWVGLWKLGLEQRLLEPLGLGWLLDFGVRSAYNPLVELADQPASGLWLFGRSTCLAWPW